MDNFSWHRQSLDHHRYANRLLMSCDGISAAAPASFLAPTPLSFPFPKADGPGPARFSALILPTREENNFRSILPIGARPEFLVLFIRMTASRIGRKVMVGIGYGENI